MDTGKKTRCCTDVGSERQVGLPEAALALAVGEGCWIGPSKHCSGWANQLGEACQALMRKTSGP